MATPPFAMMVCLMARVVSGVPDVYWEIQSLNPAARKTRDTLAAELRRLTSLVEDADEEAFVEMLNQSRKFLGEQYQHYLNLSNLIFSDEKVTANLRSPGGKQGPDFT
jgi:4-amino-4-deoxyprephenate dehydrogenase